MRAIALKRLRVGVIDGVDIIRERGEEIPEAQNWPGLALHALESCKHIVLEPDAPATSAGVSMDGLADQIQSLQGQVEALTAQNAQQAEDAQALTAQVEALQTANAALSTENTALVEVVSRGKKAAEPPPTE